MKNVPLLVYGNKADLKTRLGPDEIIDKLNINDITGRDCSLYACSALNGKGFEDGIKYLKNFQINKIYSFLNLFPKGLLVIYLPNIIY